MSEKIRLYYYMRAEYLEAFLKRHELKLTNLADTNDPFEFLPTLDFADVEEKTATSYYAHFLHVIQSFSRDLPMLVACFSRLVSSPQMWGNYADCHRGVCLVFDVPVSHLENNEGIICGLLPKKIPFVKVCYTNNRLACTPEELGFYGNDKTSYDKIWRALGYKGTCWAHEQEYRLVFMADGKKCFTQRNGLFFTSELFQYVSGIILGIRCPLSQLYVDSMIADELSEIEKNINGVSHAVINALRRLKKKKVSRAVRAVTTFCVDNTGSFEDSPEVEIKNEM